MASPDAATRTGAASKQEAGQPTMRIGELARRTGRTSRTLHFYEELGLLTPAGRTPGGFRLYGETAVVRVRWIERLQELGFSLPEIRSFLEDLQEPEHAPEAMARLRDFYAEKLRDLDASIRRMQELRNDLAESLAYLDGCRSCDPLTARDQCPTCAESGHHGTEMPPMVAAVHHAG